MSQEINFVSGRATKELAEKISKCFGKELRNVKINVFSDGEFQPSFEETIRGNELFIIQSTYAPADNLVELLMLADAAKRASAKHIIAVIPYFGYARQDRKDKPRVPIGAKLVANLLTAAGINRIITMDLHADQIQGFFDVPVDHMYASSIFIPYLRDLKLDKLTMASPDTGGTRRAATYSKFLDTDFVICYKQRSKPNEVGKMVVIGEVEGRDVVLVDDIIDTAGTITLAADLLKQKGANSVRAVCTHPILSGKAYERIENSAITELITTDTVPLKQSSSKIKVLTTANLFADVIDKVTRFDSISSHFNFTSL